jgi:hypothetical protein
VPAPDARGWPRPPGGSPGRSDGPPNGSKARVGGRCSPWFFHALNVCGAPTAWDAESGVNVSHLWSLTLRETGPT